MQTLVVALGGMQMLVFLDTNMLVYPMHNLSFGVLTNVNPQCEKFYVAVEYRLFLYVKIIISWNVAWVSGPRYISLNILLTYLIRHLIV